MKFLGYDKVICLSPHPDDVEYGMLGSILKFKNTIFDIITTSVGGNFDSSTGSTRKKECLNVVKSLSNVNSYFLDEVDYIKNITEDNFIQLVESKYDMKTYDAILIPPEEDTHQDHKKISVIGKSLTRKLKCTMIDYKTPHTLDHWIPNMFVDVSNHFDEKVKRLQEFKTQLHQSYFHDESLNHFHSDYQCCMRGLVQVESFRIIRSYL
jgi:LmbE family N-acetylglucosaminyl deacetylase